MESPVRTMYAGYLGVNIFRNRQAMAEAAAAIVADEIRQLIEVRGRAAGLFASAPSQTETLAALVAAEGIDWTKVTVYHVDEYIGLDEQHPQSMRRYLHEHLLSKVPVGNFHGIKGEDPNTWGECMRYGNLIRFDQPDFTLLGIGENGHLAFNDPGVADFGDAFFVRDVDLDETCRMQQVHDGLFPAIDDVPKRAITVTIPRLTNVRRMFAVVPGARKKAAVTAAIHGPVAKQCPASILKTHANAMLFLDEESAPPEQEPPTEG